MSKNYSNRRRYKYDAALSFAGEDRKHAEKLARLLTRRGFSVFYDANRQSDLWGKSAKDFDPIYSTDSRFVLPLVSKHYATKEWTLYEFDTAKREQKKRGGGFILPIRLDDSRLLGLPDELIRMDLRNTSVNEIARFFAEKCKPARQTLVPRRAGITPRTINLQLLKLDARLILGLIATAALPMPLPYFEASFPQYDWRRIIATLGRTGFMQDGKSLRLKAPVRKVLLNDKGEQRRLNQMWIARLGRLKRHVDTAACLCVHLVNAGRIEDAANLAADVAQYNLGWWNEPYVGILIQFAKRKPFTNLSHKTQVQVLNSLGICQTNTGRYGDAIRTFGKLRRLSIAYRDSWGLGQSLINAGVCAIHTGNENSAEKLYSLALTHAKKTHDHMLLGRTLSNLSVLSQHSDLDRAERLLEKSIIAKTAAKDAIGLAGASIVRASIAVARGDFSSAARGYANAARLSQRLGMRYEQALSIYNHGRALQDLGNLSNALRLYRIARKLAASEDFTDIALLAVNALAAGHFEAGQFVKSGEFGHELLALSTRTKSQEYRLSALHTIAISSRACAQKSRSIREFEIALAAARKADHVEWVIRCLIDQTRACTEKGVGNPNSARLRKIAKSETEKRKHRVAGAVWEMVARVESFGTRDTETSAAYRNAEQCLSAAKYFSEELLLYRNWFDWAWGKGRHEEAIEGLRKLEIIAKRNKSATDAIAAIDQRGVCLQALGAHRDAATLHKQAADWASRLALLLQQETSLNNLGEAFRQLGRHEEAIKAFRLSERIAQRNQRYESAISTAHNRALAVKGLGRHVESIRILKTCRDAAARRQLWHEYVRAWEALASLAWTSGKPGKAIAVYRRALSEARKRSVRDLEPRIGLNLALLLRGQNRSKEGLRILKPLRPQFEKFVDAHQYLGTLANLYMDCRCMREAAQAWKAARFAADKLGDAESVSRYKRYEERTLRRLRKNGLSKNEVREALVTERNPKRRADLLIQLVDLLLSDKANKSAQKAFNEGLKLCTKYRLHGKRAELHLVVGDHDLRGKYKEKLNAFKAYAVAMISTLESNMKGAGPIIAHIVTAVASPESPVTETDIVRLCRDLSQHFVREGPGTERAIKFILWPFRLAQDLAAYRRQPEQLLSAIQSLTSPMRIKTYFGLSSAQAS